MARVTSYTITYSSRVKRSKTFRLSLLSGEIFNRKTSDKRAKSRETRHKSPSEVIISFTPTSLDLDMNLDTLAGTSADVLSFLLVPVKLAWKVLLIRPGTSPLLLKSVTLL